DRGRTLAGGAVKPWQTGLSRECQTDLMKFCRKRGVPTDVPFKDLPVKWQEWVIQGDAAYGKDAAHEWPKAWYGVRGYFRSLESKSYKMHVRVLLSRYRAYRECPDCGGRRFQPDALLFRVAEPPGNGRKPVTRGGLGVVENEGAGARGREGGLTLADFYRMPIRDALSFVEGLAAGLTRESRDVMSTVLNEVVSRLRYLDGVGLGYLTLDRATRSLSGGETERVNLTTCLGTRLVNTLFVLDEPSVGLHPRDTDRLIRVLHELRDAGNTVVVVEHEASVMRAADQIVDLGPGHGETGGELVFQGTLDRLLKHPVSLTGHYLSGRRRIAPSAARAVDGAHTGGWLVLEHARRYNLLDLTVRIPLGRLVCVSGVSGSGKTTLVREVLLPALDQRLRREPSAGLEEDGEAEENNESEEEGGGGTFTGARLTGWEALGRAVLVDQSPIGRTPRSNPAVYVGAFEAIRELFARSEPAKQRGLNASAFSFNSQTGQCEKCRGAGFEKIEMQFLSDVFIRCPECKGRRYRPHVLEILIEGELPEGQTGARRARSRASKAGANGRRRRVQWSIADLLEATVEEGVIFLLSLGPSKAADRAVTALKLLEEVGLGYLRLGQPINTLSGGESQRLKLAGHLAEFSQRQRRDPKPTLFLFDEPTTGLHFEDVRTLLAVFQRLVDAGHTVMVIEHHLDVIGSADWVIDLGPGAGDEGGRLVCEGPVASVAACDQSHTGRAMRTVNNK
ncbi:MAG TPA: excinuclease ABC subunit UvrA, partial [Methylomirabilota bacterium]|nr:excinuclease ABC subunit UvrA [Methylomirabilota bacterium]